MGQQKKLALIFVGLFFVKPFMVVTAEMICAELKTMFEFADGPKPPSLMGWNVMGWDRMGC